MNQDHVRIRRTGASRESNPTAIECLATNFEMKHGKIELHAE